MIKHLFFTIFFTSAACYGQVTAFSDDFEDGLVDDILFTNWDNVDWDGDGEWWEIADMLAYAQSGPVNHPMQSMVADSDSWEGTPFNPDNWLITKDPIDLTEFSEVTLTYTVGTYQTNGTFTDDKYSIYFAAGGTVADFLQVDPLVTRLVSDDAPSTAEDGSLSAATVTLDASDFDGQAVYLAFRHFDSQDINSVLIDDVIVEGNSSLGLTNANFDNFTHFVDLNNYLNIKNSIPIDDVLIYGIGGNLIISKSIHADNARIDLSRLSTGVYLVTVVANDSDKTFKLVKK